MPALPHTHVALANLTSPVLDRGQQPDACKMILVWFYISVTLYRSHITHPSGFTSGNFARNNIGTVVIS
jgi:hypothetical protein